MSEPTAKASLSIRKEQVYRLGYYARLRRATQFKLSRKIWWTGKFKHNHLLCCKSRVRMVRATVRKVKAQCYNNFNFSGRAYSFSQVRQGV